MMLNIIPKTYCNLLGLKVFRRFWLGATLSAIGDAMSQITIVWLAIELAPTYQGIAIALTSAAYLVPGAVSGMLLGKWLGKLDCRTLVLIDCGTRFIFLSAIVFLHSIGLLSLGIYMILLILAAITRPIGAAGERVLLKSLIPQVDLFPANSLLSMATQIASIIGPACAGLFIVVFGTANVIALDALSFGIFGVIVWTLSSVDTSIKESSFSSTSLPPIPFKRLLQLRIITGLFLLTCFFHILYGPIVVALPLYSRFLGAQIGMSGPVLLGILWSSFGIGALLGGFVAGLQRSLASFMIAATIVGLWGIAVVLIGATALSLVAIIAMGIGGCIYAPYTAIIATIIQRESPPELLARVSSYWSSMTSVASPLGTIVAGIIVPAIGARSALIGSGLLTLGIACVFGLPKYFRS
ncbi:MFS transporter [Tengunoibacter tsumagoiensis]|uniref:MFS transporter n=1 Tax=Tengunoibacter tsumagoiensis TaxID=2014871 RepID=UPI000F83DD7D|nr:MFS transporter [Tengunoibacter tsumagoiensis]